MPRLGLDFALDSLGGGLGGVNCDFTTFYNGVSLVTDPFVNGSPVTGPIRIDAAGSTNDAITAVINFDPASDETFSINTTLMSYEYSADVLFTLTDVGGASYVRVQYIASSGKLYMEGHDGTSYSYMDSDTVVNLSQNYDIGFNLSGVAATKLITMTIDGVSQTDTANLNFTGVTFDKIIIATSGNLTAKLKLLLYNANSVQLGNTSFVGRLPTQTDPYGNTFISDSVVPVVYTLFPQTPLTEYYPYYGLGFGWPDAYYVSDTYCGNCNLSTYFDVNGSFNIGFVGIPAVPFTGEIFDGAILAGIRSATSGFINVKSSTYWDGADSGTDSITAYDQDADGVYHPATDVLEMDGSYTLTMINPDSQNYAIQFYEGVVFTPTNDGDTDAIYEASNSGGASFGSILLLTSPAGVGMWQIRDNNNLFIVSITGVVNLKDGAEHKVIIKTFTNGSNFDFVQYVDGVEDGRHNNVVVSGRLVYDVFKWHGTGAAPFEGSISSIISMRNDLNAFQKTALNGYYDLRRRRYAVDADSKKYYNQIVDLSNIGSTRYIEASSSIGIHPILPNTYVQKEEGYE